MTIGQTYSCSECSMYGPQNCYYHRPIREGNDPATRPFTCPVCNGHGTVSRPPWVAGDQPSWVDTGTTPYSCPACQGKGLVWRSGAPEIAE